MKNENNPEKTIIKSRSISLLSICQTELSSQSDPRWCFVYNTHSVRPGFMTQGGVWLSEAQ